MNRNITDDELAGNGKAADNELKIPQVDLAGNAELDAKGKPLTVRFRNTLVGDLFPATDFLLVTAPVVEGGSRTDAGKELVEQIAQPLQGKEIDFATGSRKHGVMWFSDQSVARRFFSTSEEAVAYGSNLVTECERIQRVNLTALVVPDGQQGTGDCHARASARLWNRFDGDPDRIMQFRLGVLPEQASQPGILAKGTALVADVPEGVELVLPQSAFKSSFKPNPGLHLWQQATLGAMSYSQERSTRVSYTVTQWFSEAAVRADLLPQARQRAQELRHATLDAGAARAYFLKHYDPHEIFLDPLTGEAQRLDPHDREERNQVLLALRTDPERFLYHPHVQGTIARFLRTKWMELATSGGERWRSRQAIPDERLKDFQVCLPGYPEGKFLMTRYPVRTRHDLIAVENKHLSDYRHLQGGIVMNEATAKLLGGDFDGDGFLFAPAERYPNLTREVEAWNRKRPPEVVKVKQRSKSELNRENLSRIVVDNMGNAVGRITNKIAAANAWGRDDVVEVLKDQLQAAVDGLKYSVAPDMARVKRVTKGIPQPEWLSGVEDPETGHRTGHLKDEKAFREYGLVAPGPGTIAYMARDVNVRFRPGQDLSRPLEAFKELVPEPPASFKTVATELKIERAVTCRQAFQTDDRRARSRAFAGYEAIREETIAELVAAEIKHLESAGPVSDETRATTLATVRRNLSLGMWHAGHQPQRSLTQEEQAANPNRRPSTGSFAFQMLDDIIDYFEQPQKLEPVAIIGVRHHEFQGQEWKGETRLVHVCTEPYGKHLGQAAYVVENGEAKKLGWVEWGKLVPETQYRMSLESTGKSVRATLVEAVGHHQGPAPVRDTAAWETVRERLVGSGVPERVVDGLHEQKRLWATELRETGTDGEARTTTALVLPTRHPRTGIQTGAQVFAVTVATETGAVREAGFAPAAETGSEAVILHSPKLRLGVGEVRAPEKVYLTSRPDAYLRLAAERSQEAASFVLLPESGVSPSLTQWLRSEKADIVLALPDTEAGQRQEAELHRFLRTEAPELHVTTLAGRTLQLEEANRIPPPSAEQWQAVRLQLVANASSREELRRIDTLHRDGRLYADAQGHAVRIMTEGEVFIRNFNTKAITRDVVSRESATEAIHAAKAELGREPARSQGMEVVAGQGRKPAERARELPAVERNQGQEMAGVEFGLGL